LALPLAEDSLEGINSTLFAYGQTGSGKTYTMVGSEAGGKEDHQGVIYRVLKYILDMKEADKSQEVKVMVQFLEIYNENVFDLIAF